MFEKLKEAYVKARNSKHYPIDENELAWLGERRSELGRVVELVCREQIAKLEPNLADSSDKVDGVPE